MAKSCDFKTSEASTKAWFRTNGAIDKFLNITDLNLFRKFNKKWSNYARIKYGTKEQLFFEEQGGTKAVPNKAAFRNIDALKGVYYNKQTENTLSQYKKETKLEDSIEQAINKFLNNYGIKLEYVNSLKERGYDANAIADITNKLILISKGNKDASVLPEEAAHFAVELLGVDNPIVARLLDIIDQSVIYQKTYEDYSTDPLYVDAKGNPNILKIKKEAIGKAIANSIIKKGKENNFILRGLKALWNKVMSMLKKVDHVALNEEIDRLSGNLGDEILTGQLKYANTENLKGNPELYKNKNISKEEDRARKSLTTLKVRLKQIQSRLDAPESSLSLMHTINEIEDSIDANENILGISYYMNAVNEGTVTLLDNISAYRRGDTSISFNSDILFDLNEFLKLHEKNVSDINTMMEDDAKLMERAPALFEAGEEVHGNLIRIKRFLENEMKKKTIEGVNNIANTENLGESLFTDGDSDIGWLATWLGSAKNSAKEIIKLLDSKLRKIGFEIDRFTRETAVDLKQAQKKLTDSGFKDFGKFYEKDSKGKKTGYLIREKNWGAWNQAKEDAKKEFMQEINKDNPNYKYDKEDYANYVNENKSKELDIKLKAFWNNFHNLNSEKEMGKYMPNSEYNNTQYAELMKNEAAKEFYFKLLDLKKDALAKLPPKYRKDHYLYFMPQIRKDLMDRIKNREEGIFGTAKELVKEQTKITKDDIDYGNHEITVNPITGEAIKFLPIHYNFTLDNMNNLSDDITGMYIAYARMAENYYQKSLAKGDIWLIEEAVRNQKVIDGKRVKGIGESNAYKMVESMIRTRLYGETKDKMEVKYTNLKGEKKKIEVGKAIDSTLAYVRRNNLVFNVFTHVANFVMGSAYAKVENIAGKYTTNSSARWAEAELTLRNSAGIIMDAGKKLKSNKVSLMLEANNIIFNITDSFKGLNENTIFGRVLSTSGLYATYEATDAHVKGKIMLSVYDNYRLFEGEYVNFLQFQNLNKGKSKSEIKEAWKAIQKDSLYNAYEAKDNKLVIKKEYAKYVDNNLEDRIRGIVNQIVDEADGTLTEDDKTMLHRTVFGRAIMTHRNWLSVGIQSRYKPKGYSYVTEMEEEGYHRTFGRNGWNTLKAIAKSVGIGGKNIEGENIQSIGQAFKTMLLLDKEMDAMERANMKKAWADLAFIVMTYAVAMMLNGLADDEPDDVVAQFLGYMGTRIKVEATAYSDPWSVLDILKSPSAGINQVESIVQFSMMVLPEWDEDTGQLNWRFNDEIERGGYKGKQRWEQFMIKRSFLKPFYEASNPEVIKSKNQYLKQIGL